MSDQLSISNIFTLKKLIQIPIEAVVDANIAASKETINFIKEFGFEPLDDYQNDNQEKGSSSALGKPRMLSFVYNYNNSGIEQRMKLEIPVLSLIPLNFLSIRRAKFDLGLNILNYQKSVKNKRQVNVLLGSVERQKSKEQKDEYVSENRMETNMQASLEVESTDLPAGILQLVNIMQEATKGDAKDLYKLHCDISNISFDRKRRTHTLKVSLTKNINVPQNNEYIKTIISLKSKGETSQYFETPIVIQKGHQVGESIDYEATALTNDDGVVEYSFTIKDRIDTAANGFIYFESPKAKRIAIYFNIKTNKK